MRHLLSVLAVLLVVSIAITADALWQPPNVTVYAPKGWEATADAVIANALSCNSALRIRRVVKNESVTTIVADFGSAGATPDSGTGAAASFNCRPVKNGQACHIFINTYWLGASWKGEEQNLFCHELGHVLGLHHEDDIDSCSGIGAPIPTFGSKACMTLRVLYP